MSAITVNGDLIHYEVLGRGRPVILVHGLLGSWRYWVPTMQQLQLKYRVYALDLYGFGDSAKNPNRYTLGDQVALLDEFMRELGVPKAALIGHDLGALVVTEFARRHEDQVPRMLLSNAPLFNPGNLDRRTPVVRRVMVAERPMFPPAPQQEIDVPLEIAPDAPTIVSASAAAMRAALLEAARARKAANGAAPIPSSVTSSVPSSVSSVSIPSPIEPPKPVETTIIDPAAAPSGDNPLKSIVSGNSLDSLLNKSFRRSEPSFEKLSVDIAKTDPRAISGIANGFDAGTLLDTLQLLPMPTVIIHGSDDPVMPLPDEDVWSYITRGKENTLLPIPLPGVRHFPMLEDERFLRIVNEFLELPDISRIEVKERWRRRTR